MVIGLQCEREPSWERHHHSQISSERWPQICFEFLSRCLGLLSGGKVILGAKGSQFDERRHLTPINCEGGLGPIVCYKPARSDVGICTVVSLGFCFFCVAIFSLIVACSYGYSGCVIVHKVNNRQFEKRV